MTPHPSVDRVKTSSKLKSALEGKITDQLGYEPHEPGGSVDGNARYGTCTTTVLT
ncbi:hypothetical protein [Cellulosimicrobium composti]|uniref:hypothetical protein n=1 Tax=Cellulosimicrobium composti TaxID=2672572 RepID=UPI0037ADA3AB